MRNIKITIAYDGTGYGGWQKQKNATTIQEEIEKRLAVMTAGPVVLKGAGRTDAGVHARGMVANFHTDKKITCEAFLRGLNSMLPSAIRILATEEVPTDFHARFSARAKTYVYTIYTGPVLYPANRFTAYHLPFPLRIDLISDCLKLLTGTHDFASFEMPGSRDKNQIGGRGSIRTIIAADICRTGDNFYRFLFTGDGFLRQMVRIMVGTVIEAGRQRIGIEDFYRIFQSKDRSLAGPPAPAHGLTLLEIYYQELTAAEVASLIGAQMAYCF